ncbi:MAG: hypothetical protein J6O51_09940, partial [Bacteroidales bacterium]|nr:hypothetical protein [Bacteroidales bacterium]
DCHSPFLTNRRPKPWWCSRRVNIDFVDSIERGPGRDFIAKLRAPFQDIGFVMTADKMKQLMVLLDE